jgi:hypothetical protein
MTIGIGIVVILVFVLLFIDSLSKAEERKLREAAAKTLKDLTRHATPEILAFGVQDSQKILAEKDAPPKESSPDDVLIDLETGKWSLLNAGRLLGTVLSTPGSVTISRGKGGNIILEGAKGDPVEMEPFILGDFRVTRPSGDTAIINYSARSGYIILRATAVWIREGGTWRTSAYQVTRGSW